MNASAVSLISYLKEEFWLKLENSCFGIRSSYESGDVQSSFSKETYNTSRKIKEKRNENLLLKDASEGSAPALRDSVVDQKMTLALGHIPEIPSFLLPFHVRVYSFSLRSLMWRIYDQYGSRMAIRTKKCRGSEFSLDFDSTCFPYNYNISLISHELDRKMGVNLREIKC